MATCCTFSVASTQEVDTVKTKQSDRKLPIPRPLLERLRALGHGEWVFRSRTGTPVNPKNALNRYLRPAAKDLGVVLSGWHDFRHTFTTSLRRERVHPKVISGVLGHANIALAMNVYDHLEAEDFRDPLARAANQLCPNVPKDHRSGVIRC